jgi:hypothetical protein
MRELTVDELDIVGGGKAFVFNQFTIGPNGQPIPVTNIINDGNARILKLNPPENHELLINIK